MSCELSDGGETIQKMWVRYKQKIKECLTDSDREE